MNRTQAISSLKDSLVKPQKRTIFFTCETKKRTIFLTFISNLRYIKLTDWEALIILAKKIRLQKAKNSLLNFNHIREYNDAA